MPQDEHIALEEIRTLAERAERVGQKSIAGILYSLGGAMCQGTESQLLDHIAPFAVASLAQIDRDGALRN